MYDPQRDDPRDFATMVRCPVSIGLCALALLATLARWRGLESIVEPLYLTPRAFADQPWRLLTCTLLHAMMPLHLLFNAYWTWRLGTIAELSVGSWRMLAFFAITASGASAAECAFSGGSPVGLSGYVYGLWAALWILGKRDPRFRLLVDERTSQFFIGWFVLCIVMTSTGMMNVANWAHGGGAALGALVGWTVSARGPQRAFGVGALVLAGVVLALLAGSLRPAVGLGREAASRQYFNEGVRAIEAGDMEAAVRWNRTATRLDETNWRAWNNLLVAYSRLGRYDEALEAQERLLELKPLDEP